MRRKYVNQFDQNYYTILSADNEDLKKKNQEVKHQGKKYVYLGKSEKLLSTLHCFKLGIGSVLKTIFSLFLVPIFSQKCREDFYAALTGKRIFYVYSLKKPASENFVNSLGKTEQVPISSIIAERIEAMPVILSHLQAENSERHLQTNALASFITDNSHVTPTINLKDLVTTDVSHLAKEDELPLHFPDNLNVQELSGVLNPLNEENINQETQLLPTERLSEGQLPFILTYANEQNRLGGEYEEEKIEGFSSEVALLKAWDCYMSAANLGHADAQYNIGRLYYNQEVMKISSPVAKELAVQFFVKAALQGHIRAQNDLGELYKNQEVPNISSEDSIIQALYWYKQAAKQNNAEAQFEIGCLYREEKISRYDKEASKNKAMKWFTAAAQQGHLYAQYNLAKMYQEKAANSLESEAKKATLMAIKLYKKAAKQKDPQAAIRLGEIYEKGHIIGVKAEDSLTLAIKWYAQAAEQGELSARISLNRLIAARKVKNLMNRLLGNS